MTDKEFYIKSLSKKLKGPKKEIQKMIADISADIDNSIGYSANRHDIENNFGNVDSLAENFNQNYITYISERRKKRLYICTVVSGCIGLILTITALIGKKIYMNGSNIAKTGGSDGPTEVIRNFEPYTILDIYNIFEKISVLFFLLFIILIIYVSIKRHVKP